MAGSDAAGYLLTDQDRDIIRAASARINDLENWLTRLGQEVGDGPDLDGLIERMGYAEVTGGCPWCRTCGSCDAGLPMNCTCGPCECPEKCGHPRCEGGRQC